MGGLNEVLKISQQIWGTYNDCNMILYPFIIYSPTVNSRVKVDAWVSN
jgi:hypothetical protein